MIAEDCNAEIQQASLVECRGDLRSLAKAGADKRGLVLDDAYLRRLEQEISVIEGKQFSDYFVFVAELVSWAKERMFVGPGRGSSGGSLLCYLMDITDVDPMVYGTLFERFLDPTRSDYPDIDVDFPDDMRDHVFEHLQEKYGAGHVARLGTISKLGGKSAINDTVKAFGIPYSVGRDFAKSFDTVNVPLAPFFNNLEDHLKPIIETHPDIEKATLLEGVPRHSGVHAAGVCVTKEPIGFFGTVDRAGVISLDLKAAEDVGLLKMDALGLRTLSVLADACRQVGKDPYSLYQLDFNDAGVFAVFNRNMVTGVFQFDGNAVRGLMKQVDVDRFDDLCALTSLARPGPLVGGAAKLYVERRAGLCDWDYDHPSLEPHTSKTFGCIVYQEQAMAIVRDIGSFDVGEVNRFRKAVGKKDPIALQGFRDQFLDAAIGVMGEEPANKVWDEMCEFGSYAFNYSHAVAYSMISYMCAWFKANHPVEFAVAQLRNAADEDQAKALLRELQEEGHRFVPFDPSRSTVDWHVDNGVLIGGFTSVKGIGKKTAEKMIEIRSEHGDDWMSQLTEAQRRKLTIDFNTPWHDLNRFAKLYGEIYDNSLDYRSEALPRGARGPIYRIADIPEEKGKYTFLARLTKRQPRDKTNDKGEVVGEFCNLFFEDDTGTVGSTINQYKWKNFKWLMEDNYDGEDFIVKGNIINDGRLWLFIENLIQLGPDDRRQKDDDQT
jgi:DNA-directed DNA polymerase III PolC